ncbi:5-(carboxyamino)imidazole ribonucleotide synthase [Alteromonas oceanisediminis]|uniref:5-(carboxyamino)imidazole ribonucleotide synthase n=1 Tax=Alteromonas oceanisediminis TaxID=2836180 RepID=UPI001BDA4494|nr:5-(carboxyamino)imidazole ribonucleotide synthase [Alteromonas oceanisediminis]MBT0586010.1 5-(carboxyamino)imidazole ribonucleotide synthase [Alteromonas oceanisediminis]
MKVLVYGAGQLAQMMNLAGAPLGISVNAVDVKTGKVVNPVDKSEQADSLKNAIDEANCLTVEFEHVPVDLLNEAHASGKLSPSFESIRVGADRVIEKKLLERLGIANCAHRVVTAIDQLPEVVEQLGDKLILKASLDGYDGYGQWRLSSREQLVELQQTLSALDLQKVPLVVEQMQTFERELSLLGARNANGDIVVYPLAENLHHQGQLHVSVAPASALTDELNKQALAIFTALADELNYVGLLAVEMFQVGDRLLVNELAPRVHNSGHWTQQGAVTSQFENHLRAIQNLPLGSTEATGISAMVNVIGCGGISKEILSVPNTHLHWYGKSVRKKRKMGHINVVAESYSELSARLSELNTHLPAEYFPKLPDEIQRLAALR